MGGHETRPAPLQEGPTRFFGINSSCCSGNAAVASGSRMVIAYSSFNCIDGFHRS
jgi:hypothetical protein